MGECFSHALRKTPLKIRQSIFLRRLDFFQGKNLVDVIAVLDIRIYAAWLDAQGNVAVSFVAQLAAGGFGDKMTRDAIQKIICEGENSHIEFKSEAVSNEELAIAMIAFSNGQGGVILLGVEDDGQISGIAGMPDKKMNAINQICQNTVKPPIIPTLDAYSFDERTVLANFYRKGNTEAVLSVVRNGMIELPKKYRERLKDQVRVIVLTGTKIRQKPERPQKEQNFADFLKNSIKITDFIMPSRDERNQSSCVH